MTAFCSLTAHFRFFMLRCCFFSYINFTIRVHFCCRLRSGDAQAFFLIGMCWKIEESHIELKEIDFWSNTDSKFSANLLESAIKSRALIRANEKKIATKMSDWTEIYCFILSYIFFVLFNLLKSFSNDLFSALLLFFYYSSELCFDCAIGCTSARSFILPAILLISFLFIETIFKLKKQNKRAIVKKEDTQKRIRRSHCNNTVKKLLWVFSARAPMACQLFRLMFNKIANFIHRTYRLSVNMSIKQTAKCCDICNAKNPMVKWDWALSVVHSGSPILFQPSPSN